MAVMETESHRLNVLERLCLAGSSLLCSVCLPSLPVEIKRTFGSYISEYFREFDNCSEFLLALGLDKTQYFVTNSIAKCIR